MPPERGCQVEAEAIHVHLVHPESQAVTHHPPHRRHPDVERVAAPGQVLVGPGLVTPQSVVADVVESAEGHRWPAAIALTGVVVDDVKQDLDPRGVKPADHFPELMGFPAGTLAKRRSGAKKLMEA